MVADGLAPVESVRFACCALLEQPHAPAAVATMRPSAAHFTGARFWDALTRL